MSDRDAVLGRQLVLDELFDLSLYRELAKVSSGPLRGVLEELIPIETRHYAFWQEFFQVKVAALDAGRVLKLRVLALACRLGGPTVVHLVLEAIEVYGIKKYLSLWDRCQGTPTAEAVRGILLDEFKHEDEVVSKGKERALNPERIRSIFLGLNDGLVEMLGAVSGFYAAFSQPSSILAASVSVATAGSLSMAAGAYVAASSGREVQTLEDRKARFLGAPAAVAAGDSPLFSALLVGASYFVGAFVPVLPVALGARSVALSVAAGAALMVLLSLILAFLSGMAIRKRIAVNAAIIAAAVGVSYAIGTLAKSVLGVEI